MRFIKVDLDEGRLGDAGNGGDCAIGESVAFGAMPVGYIAPYELAKGKTQ